MRACRPSIRREWQWRDDEFPDTEDSQKASSGAFAESRSGGARDCACASGKACCKRSTRFRKAPCQRTRNRTTTFTARKSKTLIASQRFRDFEMPANADTTFWTDIGYTARRPFRTLEDYRHWIAQMRDIPRYFREQTDEMRAGLKRGFTPPRRHFRRARMHR